MSDDDSDDDWFEQAISEDPDGGDGPSTQTDETSSTGAEDDQQTPDSDVAAETSEFEAALDSVSESTSTTEDGGADSITETGAVDASTDEDGGDVTAQEGEGALFDEDFASALDSAGGPGGDSGGAAAENPFEDDESFESEIPRIDLGIEGLDGMIQGGIPQRHLMVVIGSPGTGKTTFGLQFLHHGLQQGEDVVFITLEQSRESILDTADERGWEFDRYEREDRLAIVDLDPVEMANSLENIRGEFPELVREFGADRLVLDSVSLLEMMYDDQARRRTEVFDFTRSLKEAGVTTMFTSEANEDNPYASRHGIIEYLTDAVFVLQYVRGDTQETRLAVEIQKIRNANHSRATKPYAITLDGIDVYQQASIF
ncbi:KaiC domain-containing protein [Halorhabdus sp. BNX81]|uniref:KaiC domain-containing protein n=1 Tax=Halorhabdus sp. BNX81 TaxID=2980181 RepID=UPI0023DCF2A5|nr:KaiC domain-containing protein [Halorhabdus sp. BNX81]WEL20312.1 RecA-superfamily ATPase implicated in signal transduction [Halorhabdus sp. BNX81]